MIRGNIHSHGAPPPLTNGYHPAEAPTPPSGWSNILTPGRVASAFWVLFVIGISAGWIMLPAKESDLKALTVEVSGMREDLQAMSAGIASMTVATQGNREEIIRLSATLAAAAAPPVVPVARKKLPTAARAGSFRALVE